MVLPNTRPQPQRLWIEADQYRSRLTSERLTPVCYHLSQWKTKSELQSRWNLGLKASTDNEQLKNFLIKRPHKQVKWNRWNFLGLRNSYGSHSNLGSTRLALLAVLPKDAYHTPLITGTGTQWHVASVPYNCLRVPQSMSIHPVCIEQLN